jgi:hypothetical protein
MTAAEVSLEGTIDLHVHSAPDVWPRRLDDLSLAREAAAAGMRAVVLKSHHTLTADRAAIVDNLVEGVRVFGGLALNAAVGGLNPAAVEAALKLGARQIWMPTISAANHLRVIHGTQGGICVLDEEVRLRSPVFEILSLIAEKDVILGTGHLSVEEIRHLVPAARAAKVRRIVITHPELYITNMPIPLQQELAGPDLFFERCLIATVHPGPVLPAGLSVSLAAIAAAVREVGPETTVLATDFGQPNNPPPVEGLRDFISSMLNLGISQADIDRVTRDNPAWLLGL